MLSYLKEIMIHFKWMLFNKRLKALLHELFIKRKFKSVFRLFHDSKYRSDIARLKKAIDKRTGGHRYDEMILDDIHHSHDINYPEWVDELIRQYDRSNDTFVPIVVKDGNRFVVVDGNHRLAAMKELYRGDLEIKVKILL